MGRRRKGKEKKKEKSDFSSSSFNDATTVTRSEAKKVAVVAQTVAVQTRQKCRIQVRGDNLCLVTKVMVIAVDHRSCSNATINPLRCSNMSDLPIQSGVELGLLLIIL